MTSQPPGPTNQPQPQPVRDWSRGHLLALVCLLLGVLLARALLSAHLELERGDQAMEEQAPARALVHYRRAARWYVPASPLHVSALDRLASIAKDAENQTKPQLALSAHRAIRGAILSARSFYTPEQERLDHANRRIAELMAALPPPPIDAGKSRAQLRDEHLKLLQADNTPDVLWTLILLVGFATWVAGAFVFVERAIAPNDQLIRPEALRWGAVIVFGLALFAVGMAFA